MKTITPSTKRTSPKQIASLKQRWQLWREGKGPRPGAKAIAPTTVPKPTEPPVPSPAPEPVPAHTNGNGHSSVILDRNGVPLNLPARFALEWTKNPAYRAANGVMAWQFAFAQNPEAREQLLAKYKTEKKALMALSNAAHRLGLRTRAPESPRRKPSVPSVPAPRPAHQLNYCPHCAMPIGAIIKAVNALATL